MTVKHLDSNLQGFAAAAAAAQEQSATKASCMAQTEALHDG
jgi:hypothetical protein